MKKECSSRMLLLNNSCKITLHPVLGRTEGKSSAMGRINVTCSKASLKYRTRNEVVFVSCSVVPDALQPHGLHPTRLLCPWDFPGKDTGVGCHFLLQRILPTQGSNLDLLHCRQILYRLSHQGRFFFSWETMIWSVWGCRAEGKNLTSLGEFAQGSLENP